MSVALHLKAPLSDIADMLEALLLPDSSAVLVPRGDWVSVYAEQLSQDLADITELAAPLSSAFGSVWATSDLHHRFDNGAHAETTHVLPKDVPSEFEVDVDDELPRDAVRVTRDADKPGLAEFFGRSSDE
jgi:hypothetical protein